MLLIIKMGKRKIQKNNFGTIELLFVIDYNIKNIYIIILLFFMINKL